MHKMDSIQLKHLGNLLLYYTTDGVQEILTKKWNVEPPTINKRTDIVYGTCVN